MLRYKADIRTLLVVALYFLFATLPWIIGIQLNFWQNAAFVVINCLLSFTCAVIVHNTIHVPIFRNKWENRIFQVILSFTYGHPVSAYVPGHNFSHHKYTQTAKDSIRTSKARFKINLFNQLFFFFIMAGDIIKGEIKFVKKMYKSKPAWFLQYMVELVLVFGTKIALLLIDWQKFLLFVFIPHQYAAWGIVSTNYFQHDGCDENHLYNHSRNFTGKWFNWFMFNNGYHGAHHMKPGLHWSLLPHFYETQLRPYIHPSLDRESMIQYLWETHVYPGKRVDYLGNPIKLAPADKDEDWVAEIKVHQHEEDMAVV
ncbi:MAG: fatty acid desaturase [Bacteroidota bacterium]|nr:fatty acid desaturase [Bacteroidota bacterium]